MAAELVWYESDGITPLARLEFGSIMPGNTYYGLNGAYLPIVLKNDGDLSANVVVTITQKGTNVAHTYMRVATGVGTPGTFFDHTAPIDIGALAPAGSAEFWVDIIVPGGAPLAATESGDLVATGS